MKVNVYVDGFNLYYGLKRFEQPGESYKWLDLAALWRRVLPGDTINRVRYFTALIQPRPGGTGGVQRQQVYIRALHTIPNLSVHYGQFLVSYPRMVLRHPPPIGTRTVEVIKTEEKGSDVNLATLMLCDGFDGDYDVAVIVSNDSDLCMPIEVVRNKLKLQVGVLNPHRNTSWALKNVANFYRPIREGALKASQFPITLRDAKGVITKPRGW